MTITMTRIMRIKKGKAPLKISAIFVSFTIPWRTKRLRPTGGVTIAISIFNTTITLSQIRSMFKALMMGRKIGIVIKIIAAASRKHPRNR